MKDKIIDTALIFILIFVFSLLLIQAVAKDFKIEIDHNLSQLNKIDFSQFYKAQKHKKNQKKDTSDKNIDFGPYMENLQRKIKTNWHPPKSTSSERIKVLFTISKDGKLLKCRIKQPSNNKAANKSALMSIRLASPFDPLPKNYTGTSVDIEFTFDYNVFNKKH